MAAQMGHHLVGGQCVGGFADGTAEQVDLAVAAHLFDVGGKGVARLHLFKELFVRDQPGKALLYHRFIPHRGAFVERDRDGLIAFEIALFGRRELFVPFGGAD